MKYVIDTMILINFSIYLPRNYHPTFWRWLEDQIAQGNIIILDVVVKECRSNPVKSWVNSKSIKRYIVATDNSIKDRAKEINSTHGLITEEAGITKSQADPVIIAYAEMEGHAVFTQERERRAGETRNKIPDVCRSLGVPCERFPQDILRQLSFSPI